MELEYITHEQFKTYQSIVEKKSELKNLTKSIKDCSTLSALYTGMTSGSMVATAFTVVTFGGIGLPLVFGGLSILTGFGSYISYHIAKEDKKRAAELKAEISGLNQQLPQGIKLEDFI